ncbi:hypothetical protein SAE02_78030 [Skermanella aerolata]|uniref:Uncharacterized protein n=1 Tax=Skermanella aerolata TaxID=393310 RepID=A0A512E4J3_9PROT|nr:hypothetical protein [Skermanella aerolata]KJB90083.1 hypothetical protein N826_07345 [Skermanella aerolata KACC 11604]GEO43655.1 hypothetical protein SAE02_78030 [Skermanella aerolata]
MTEIHPRILKRLQTERVRRLEAEWTHACRRLRKERLIIGGLADTAIGSELNLPELCEVLDDALVTLAALGPEHPASSTLLHAMTNGFMKIQDDMHRRLNKRNGCGP